MKFGEQLRSSLIKEWAPYYINYEDLKNALKTKYETEPTRETPKPRRKPWTEADERQFIALLEAELDKVFTFQKIKSDEIVARIQESEEEVEEVIKRLDHPGGRRPSQIGRSRSTDYGPPTNEDFFVLENYLGDIIADVHDLAKYVQLNYTGFQKIIKKHDKRTKWFLKPVFAARLKAKPFFKDNYDAFVVKLSKLYDLVRTRGNPVQGDSSAGGGQQNFIRETTKYWVHPDNITELKLIILKASRQIIRPKAVVSSNHSLQHLPVLVFNPRKEFSEDDTAISSIYYDNTATWELYTGRLKKTEGAEAIRLRWYGPMDNDQIFVERKTHREDWTGEKSVKARFPIKEKYVNAYLSGEMTVAEVFKKLRKEGKKSEQQISDWEQLAKEIQYRVITRKLVPVTRSFYRRTAFQLPGDARVRISLDTDLSMIREDNLDGRQRAGSNWRRMDIGIDYPFKQLPPEDIERFPYAILEVKLQTQAGQEPPQWIRELTASHLVEAVPKFSKFIHGTANIFPHHIKLLPYWMPQMDADIRKPRTDGFGIERPTRSRAQSDDLLDYDDSDEEDDESGPSSRIAATPVERSNQDPSIPDDQGAAGNALDLEERIAAAQQYGVDDALAPLYDSDDEEEYLQEDLEEARRMGGKRYYKLLFKWYLFHAEEWGMRILKSAAPIPRSTITAGGLDCNTIGWQVKRFKAPRGKKIHVPVRVEPKVYFAAERTFLSWLEFSIVLGSIASALLNFGNDAIALWSAWAFTVLAALALLYSFMLYLWRVDKIRKRRAVKRVYHEKWGPTVLCVGLLGCVLVNFALRIKELRKD
ncbi:vacuolar transporter chaperone [Ascosphaera aggregata]|nr:vacuolar transporter chaperone [Ascosphaera aggregata]